MHDIQARQLLSPHMGFNLYRGCTHGCIYCDSRSTCYRISPPFTDVAVKRNAPELLEAALRRRRRPCMLGTGSMCDPYLPLEDTEQLMQRCLLLIERYGFGLSLLTKSDRVLRDLPLLKRIHKKAKVVVCTTLTTWDESLCRVIEPNVSSTQARVEMLRVLQQEGIPTGVWLCPILPFLNDTPENLHAILERCFSVGVRLILNFGMGVTLRDGSREYFYSQLDRHFPGLKARYVQHFHGAYQCLSPRAAELSRIFVRACRAQGVLHTPEDCFAYLTHFPDPLAEQQLRFF